MKKATWIEAYRAGPDPIYVFWDGSIPVYKLKTRHLAKLWEAAQKYTTNPQSVNILVAPESKSIPEIATTQGFHEKLLEIAGREAAGNYGWRDDSGARKYTKKFEPVFGKGRFPWCAAFVTWCLEESGVEVPLNMPSKFGYTSALVEAWQQWAIDKGYYLANHSGFQPLRGDIVLFDWSNPSDPDYDWEDHIGFFSHESNGVLICLEGNHRDRTAIVKRYPSQVQGYIRLPETFSFD